MQLRVPKPPKGLQKPLLMACVGKNLPVNLDPASQPLGHAGTLVSFALADGSTQQSTYY